MTAEELEPLNAEAEQAFERYLVVCAQGGSGPAFERLARRFTPRLLRFAVRTVGDAQMAREIVQETWIGAIRGLPGLSDAAKFRAWIYGIAHRKCVDAVRTEGRWRKLLNRAQVDAAILDAAGAPHGFASDATLDIAAATARLGAAHRAVVQLFYGEDLTVEEIASALALPRGTVKSRLFHARDTIKKLLGE